MTHPPEPLDSLIEIISYSIAAHSEMDLGFRYRQEDEVLELIVYPSPIELIGGPEDGSILVPGFSLDIHSLLASFQNIDAVYWMSQGFSPDDPMGPLLSIEGVYQGQAMWIRIMAEAPEDEPPGMKIDTLQHFPENHS